jgi:CBS domain-containing protein
MEAREVMTRDVVSATTGTSVEDAIGLMLSNRVSGLPVVDARGALVGMVTEGDLMRRAETGTETRRGFWQELLTPSEVLSEEYVRSHGRKVEEVMTAPPISVLETTPLGEVVELMLARRIKRVPVVSATGAVVGLLSRADILQALRLRMTSADDRREEEDRLIRQRIIEQAKELKWLERGLVEVTVKAGVVTLSGMHFGDGEHQALRVLVENTPGVTGIDDRLTRAPNFGIVLG